MELIGEQRINMCIFQVWLTKGPQCDIPVQIISLALYIELSLGKLKELMEDFSFVLLNWLMNEFLFV